MISAAVASAAALALPSMTWAASELPTPSRPGSNLDKLVRAIDPRLRIVNAHTNERVDLRFFGPGGYDFDAVRRLNHIWRDWRQNEAPQIDPRMFWALAAISMSAQKEGHDGEIVLLSGFRTLKTNALLRSKGYGAASNSFHLKAMATDFRFEGVPQDRVGGFVEWLGVGGTGYYPRSGFTHVDTGPIRRWGK